MTTVSKHIAKAIEATAESNAETLQFIADFKGANGKDLRNRWELWLQIELMRQLDRMKKHPEDLHSEFRANYKANKHKGAGRTSKGFVSGSLDIAFRPAGGDKHLLAGVEIKVKRRASAAIRGGLHDLLKPRAFVSSGWNFRAIYVMCVFDATAENASDSKYLKFAEANGAQILQLGNCFKVALIGWDTKPRSGHGADFYREYNNWVKDLLLKAKESGLVINLKPRKKKDADVSE